MWIDLRHDIVWCLGSRNQRDVDKVKSQGGGEKAWCDRITEKKGRQGWSEADAGDRGHGLPFPPRIYNDPESFDFMFIYIRKIALPKPAMTKYLRLIIVNELVDRVAKIACCISCSPSTAGSLVIAGNVRNSSLLIENLLPAASKYPSLHCDSQLFTKVWIRWIHLIRFALLDKYSAFAVPVSIFPRCTVL